MTLAFSLFLTMVSAAVVYVMTGSMLLAGVTGVVGGVSYSRAIKAEIPK